MLRGGWVGAVQILEFKGYNQPLLSLLGKYILVFFFLVKDYRNGNLPGTKKKTSLDLADLYSFFFSCEGLSFVFSD